MIPVIVMGNVLVIVMGNVLAEMAFLETRVGIVSILVTYQISKSFLI